MLNIENRDELSKTLLGGPFGEFRFEVQKRFYAISCLLEDAEQVLSERKDELQKKYDEELSEVDWSQYEYRNDYTSFLEPEFELRHVTVYYALYNASFLSAFTLFEASLRILYVHLQKAKKRTDILKPKWKLSSLVSDFKTELNIDLLATSEWEILDCYREIRNAIAHRNGEIELEGNQKLEKHPTYKAIKTLNTNLVLFGPEPYFRIANKEFISDFISSVYKLYNELEEPILKEIGDYRKQLDEWMEETRKLNEKKDSN